MKIDKIYTELGWAPKHNLKDGLEKTVQWYLAQHTWIEAIQKELEYQGWLNKNYTERNKE